MTTPLPARPHPAPASGSARPLVRLSQVEVRAGGRRTLAPLDLELIGGELVAIAGGSGAGKTTLLEVAAGVRAPHAGTVEIGADLAPARAVAGTGRVGFVPQDDIVHRELPLRRMLVHAARLRLPRSTADDIDRRVDSVLAQLDLGARADVKVGSLSGGQRTRASVAVELLSDPEVLLLDEPTSGLDPASAAEVTATLRRLAGRGITVVMTTHDPLQIASCDRVVVLAPEGRLAFVGAPDEAPGWFDVAEVADIYRVLGTRTAADWAARWTNRPQPEIAAGAPPADDPVPAAPPTARRDPLRQFAVLTRRGAEVVAGNRLTLAILLGSPVLVITMMAVLFRPGEFDRPDPAAAGPGQTVFWIAFAGFFFGLTYGLLQVVTERAVVERERFAGVSPAAYLGSKVALLLPVLVGVDLLLLGVLRALDRLPDAGGGTYVALAVTLVLESLAGLLLGLATSAAVADASQATLALPMLCFPQVLFAGAVVPVGDMAGAGRFLSTGMVTRWAFESSGRALDLATDPSAPHHDAFRGAVADGWSALVVLAVVGAVGAHAALARRGRAA